MAGRETKEKKRALPTEFDRQVQQIRNDMSTVRANLDAAERALLGVPPLATNESTATTTPVGASIIPTTVVSPQPLQATTTSPSVVCNEEEDDTYATTTPVVKQEPS